MDNNKKIDAVKMMREIKDRLSSEYTLNPDKEDRDLSKIRNKYNIKRKVKTAHF